MSKYAIVNIAGKQYKIEEGQEFLVNHLTASLGNATFDQVLMVVDGDKTVIGNPTVKGAKVEAEIQGEEKGEKIRVVKFKAKSRYRKTRGFRSINSKVKILKISA